MSTAGTGWRDLRSPARGDRTPSTFARLSRTHALAMAGDTLITLALAGSLFFSISPTAARGRVALSLLLTMAPFAVVAPLLGPAIDRSSRGRRAMVVATCALRAVTCIVMARVLDGLLLFPAAFAVLVLSKSYTVAKAALVPAAVRSEDELVEANAKLAITGVVAGFLVSGPGILLLKVFGGEWTLALAAVVFVAATVSAVRLPSDPPAERSVSENAPSGPDSRHRTDGGERAESLGVVAAAVVMALLRAIVGFVTFLVAFGFRHLGAPSWWFGVVLAASMAATLAGSAIAPRLRRSVREERMLAACLALVAVAGFGFGQVHGGLYAAAVAAAVGVAAGTGKLAFDSLVQREVPDHQRGRSFARFEAGFQLVWVVGALLPVVVATPLRQGYDVLGIAAGLATVAYVFVTHRLARSA